MSCCEPFSTRLVVRARLIAVAALLVIMPTLALANSGAEAEGQSSVETDGAVRLSVRINKAVAQVECSEGLFDGSGDDVNKVGPLLTVALGLALRRGAK